MRGLFGAALLAALEEDLRINVTDHFDLLVGTSTGGIIALGLGFGLRPKEIVEFYVEHGPGIFDDAYGVRKIGHWFRRKFSGDELARALQSVLPEPLGKSQKQLVIPAYNLQDNDVYLFRTPHHPRLRRDYRVPAWKVALATSAAPTYFPAATAVDGIRLVDGGTWANNPAMIGLIEGHKTLDSPLTQIKVLSIGTFSAVRRRPTRLDGAGKFAWAPHAIDLFMDAQSVSAHNHVSLLLDQECYVRVDPIVGKHEFSLDRPSDSKALIARARVYGRHLAEKFSESFAGHTAPPFMPIYSAPID